MIFNEKIILSGIEETIAQLGVFSPTQHWERVRESNSKLKRVKENVLKKQVEQVWNKHGREIKREVEIGQNEVHQSLNPSPIKGSVSHLIIFRT